MKKYNVGIIGYGWAASAHIDAINKTKQGQVTAIYSSRKLDDAERHLDEYLAFAEASHLDEDTALASVHGERARLLAGRGAVAHALHASADLESSRQHAYFAASIARSRSARVTGPRKLCLSSPSGPTRCVVGSPLGTANAAGGA